MKLTLSALAAAAVLAFASAPLLAQSVDSTAQTGTMQNMDATAFVKMAASGGMFELQSSQMALSRAQNEQIKSFAQKMIDDHTKANEELTAAAKNDNIDTPAGVEMNAKHKQMLDQLEAAQSAQFDQLYV
jgi:putative membrane protein